MAQRLCDRSSYRGDTSVTAIVVDGLRKSYGAVEAVRGVSFHVDEGEVFGLLGPTVPARRQSSRSSRATERETPAT